MGMYETRDIVSIRLDKILVSLPSSPSTPSIFRVDDYVDSANERLHDPKLVSIGPIHHGKEKYHKMEQHKFRYLKLLLQQHNGCSVDKYVVAIRSLEEHAHRSYADPVKYHSDEFVEMLLLDGCFIIELVRKCKFPQLRERDDPIFKYDHIHCQLVHDLMLIENQIPFFVLDRLFFMTKSGGPYEDLVTLIQDFVGNIYPRPYAFEVRREMPAANDVDHILGLIYKTWYASFGEKAPRRSDNNSAISAINSVSELQEAGIRFEKDTRNHFLDIKFHDGEIKIQPFIVADGTETIFRNLILYEHYSSGNASPKYVTDYAYFLHCLINSSRDVEILRLKGILTNMLGDDDMVHHMLKSLDKNVLLSRPNVFRYSDVFNRVNEHYRDRSNRWMANLRRNYFYSPWAYISFSAAVVLLILTVIQTAVSILPYV